MIEGIKNDWSAHGKRVILLARKILPAPQPKMSNDFESRILESAKTGLTLVGLVSIEDPPRAEVPGVVQTLRGASLTRLVFNQQCTSIIARDVMRLAQTPYLIDIKHKADGKSYLEKDFDISQ